MSGKYKLGGKAAVVGASLWLAFSCATASAEDLVHIRVGAASNIGFGPFFVLDDEDLGIAAKHGLDWDMRIFASGAATMEAALAGSLDTTVFTPQVGMGKISSGQACLEGVVTFVEMSSTRLAGFNDIQTASDLVGKKVGTLAGAVGEIALMLWLEQNDVSPDGVEIVNITPPDMPVALARHDVDAIVWVEPTPSLAIEVTGADKVHYIGDLSEAYSDVNPFNITCAWREANGDEAVEKLIAAWIEASDFMKTNPEDAAAITAKALQLDPAEVLDLWKKGGWLDGPTGWPANLTDGQIDMLQKVANFLVAKGKLPEHPDLTKWVKSKWLREVAPDRVHLDKYADY